MSTLTLLPLVRVADGVQPNEDCLSIAFYLDDGITPIDLTSLSFTLQVGSFATLTSPSAGLVVSGPSNNVLSITALAAQTTGWPVGVASMTLAATDGVYTSDVFALSTLSVGSPQIARVSLVVAPDFTLRSIASPIPTALATALQALQPTALAQAVFASLPLQTGPNAPVDSGQAFVNSSGYVVIAQ